MFGFTYKKKQGDDFWHRCYTRLRGQWEDKEILYKAKLETQERFIQNLLAQNTRLRNELHEQQKEVSWHWPQPTSRT